MPSVWLKQNVLNILKTCSYCQNSCSCFLKQSTYNNNLVSSDALEFSRHSSQSSIVRQCESRFRAQGAVLRGAAGRLPLQCLRVLCFIVPDACLFTSVCYSSICLWAVNYVSFFTVPTRLIFLHHAQTQQPSARSSATPPVNWGRGRLVEMNTWVPHVKCNQPTDVLAGFVLISPKCSLLVTSVLLDQ